MDQKVDFVLVQGSPNTTESSASAESARRSAPSSNGESSISFGRSAALFVDKVWQAVTSAASSLWNWIKVNIFRIKPKLQSMDDVD